MNNIELADVIKRVLDNQDVLYDERAQSVMFLVEEHRDQIDAALRKEPTP